MGWFKDADDEIEEVVTKAGKLLGGFTKGGSNDRLVDSDQDIVKGGGGGGLFKR